MLLIIVLIEGTDFDREFLEGSAKWVLGSCKSYMEEQISNEVNC